jgi:hypothetical protein
MTAPAPPGPGNTPSRPLARPGPILVVVAIGALAIIVAIASIVRRPAVPAVISEDYTRVAGSLLLPEVRDADPAALARALNGRQRSLVVRLPLLRDAGYMLEGGAIRRVSDKPGVVAIYRNRAMDLLVAHAYQGSLSELPGPPEVRQVSGRRFVLQRKSTNILVFWQEGPVVMVVTSSLPVEQVVKLATHAAQSLDAVE